jgi:hypothetical protein
METDPPSLKFGELQSPNDLVRKLEHDLKRIASGSNDQYAAFDFFVTADSLVDWRWPEHPTNPSLDTEYRKIRRDVRKLQPLPRIAAHIANGAKHFVATRHDAIAGIEKARVCEEGVYETGVFYEPILVSLTPKEAIELCCQESVEVEWLARKLLAYWRTRLNDS